VPVGECFCYDDKLEPWSADIQFEHTTDSFDFNFMVKDVPWISTLGHVIVINNAVGVRVAIVRIFPMGSAMPFTIRLGWYPHLALESWSEAICQKRLFPGHVLHGHARLVRQHAGTSLKLLQ